MAKVLIIEVDEALCQKFQELMRTFTDFSFDIARTYVEADSYLDRSRYEFAIAETDLPDAMRGKIIALLNRYNISPIIFTDTFDADFSDGFESANIADYVLKNHPESIIEVLEKLKRLEHNRNKTVLLVDDATLYRSYLQQNLVMHNFRVLSASSDSEALKRLQVHFGIELMIVNFHSSNNIDVIELIKKARALMGKKDLHIVVLTSETDSYSTASFLREGANDYITKPFSRDEFYARIYKNTHPVELFESAQTGLSQNILNLFSEMTEFKNLETSSHIKRISEYSYLLAKLYGMFDGEANVVGEMAILHDVGKMFVPYSTLSKPDQLTVEEFEVIKQHTVMGEEFIEKAFKENQKIGKIAKDIAKYHHERWDGTGYPEGLLAREIPIAARIVSLVDVFDALINERIYKEAWDLEDVLFYIEEHSGTQFDPDLVRLFVNNIECFMNVLRKYDLDSSRNGFCRLSKE